MIARRLLDKHKGAEFHGEPRTCSALKTCLQQSGAGDESCRRPATVFVTTPTGASCQDDAMLSSFCRDVPISFAMSGSRRQLSYIKRKNLYND